MILLDTSGMLAAIDSDQVQHDRAAQVLVAPQQRILSPFVLAELDYLIATKVGQHHVLTLLRDVANGVYQLEPFSDHDVAAAIRVIERYRDLELGIADASIVVLAERHRCWDVLTLDQRHFRTIAGPDGRPFRLLPLDTN